MQATVGTRQFGFGGLKSALMVAAFAAGIAVGVGVPTALNHAPWRHAGGQAVGVASAPVNPILDEGRVSPQKQTAQLARFFDAKMTRQDELDMRISAAARVAQQETTRRFYAHKEA